MDKVKYSSGEWKSPKQVNRDIGNGIKVIIRDKEGCTDDVIRHGNKFVRAKGNNQLCDNITSLAE